MKILQLKADMNARLLDRSGSDPVALELLKSDVQQHVFNVTVDERPSPYGRMLGALQVALMLISGGAALMWLAGKTVQPDETFFLQFLGALGLALGAGALCSAIAALVVGRMWKSLHASS